MNPQTLGRVRRAALSCAAAFALFLGSTSIAHAFCRTRTCDPAVSDCAKDARGCIIDGESVFWSSSCITVSVQAQGAPAAGVDYEAAAGSVRRSFDAWTSVTCPEGGSPSLTVMVNGPVECRSSEYNPMKRNANIVMFHDERWPYERVSPDALGFTRIRFDTETGELFDVDIEINAATEPLSVDRLPEDDEVDLDSVIAHEVGHLLGLNHTPDVAATMVSGYQTGSIELRDPAPDDIRGICAVYPPGREVASTSCTPRHGFSELCAVDQTDEPPRASAGAPGDPDSDGDDASSEGCAFAASRPGANLALALLLGLLVRRLRKPHPRRLPAHA
jgi:hypothetical protein